MTDTELDATKTLGMVPAPGWIIINAVRYALSRHTDIVRETTGWLKDWWHMIDEPTRQQILEDIRSDLDRYRHLDAGAWELGDVAAWRACLELEGPEA